MAAHVRTVVIPEADRGERRRRARSKGAPARVVERARIVLLSAEGVPGKQIAARVGCAEPTAVTWRRRYAERGLPGLAGPPAGGVAVGAPGGAAGSGAGADADRAADPVRATHWS